MLRFDLGRQRGCVADVTDDTLARILARLPSLVEVALIMKTRCELHYAFRTAGERCRQLETLALHDVCYLRQLEGASVKPLFPRLQRLLSGVCRHSSVWDKQQWE